MSGQDIVQLLEGMASAAVAAYPTLSLSVAYINGTSVSTLHYGGDLVATPTDDSIYALGPISNTFTGAVLAHAVASQQLSLSTPVKEVVAELEGTAFPEDITLLSLATHTSGLPSDPPGFYDTPLHKYSGFDEEALMAFLATYTAPPPPPGPAAYSYSTLGAGLLAFSLERALDTPWEQLLHDAVTGPDALDMPDTSCMLTSEQQERAVQGYVHEWDYKQATTPKQREEWELEKVRNFYAVPDWDWTGNPLKGAGCLHTTLPDMVKYIQAANGGAEALSTECHANYLSPGPHTSRCLTQPPDIQQLLGYSQQRQAVQGPRWQTQGMPYFVFDTDEAPPSSSNSAADPEPGSDGVLAHLKQLFQPVADAAIGMLPKRIWAKQPTIEDIGEGVGLLWMTEDWSDSPHMPSGIKYHTARTSSSSGILVANSDLQLGVVVLASFPGTDSLGFYPEGVGYTPWMKWWCGAAGVDCGGGE